jgi:hypothetical protein
MGIPVGIACNFMINGRDVQVPMATEEASVVAAASNGALIARVRGGFFTSSTGAIMQVQVQVLAELRSGRPAGQNGLSDLQGHLECQRKFVVPTRSPCWRLRAQPIRVRTAIWS